MNIQEAVKKAMKTNSFITCTTSIGYRHFKIKPTDTLGCCMVIPLDLNAPPTRGWQPKAEDLISDNWIVID